MCEAGLKSAQSRDTICEQDLELSQTELQACEKRQAAAEAALKENDCSAVKKDLRTCNEWTDQLKHDNDVLKKQLAELASSSAQIKALEDKLAAAQQAVAAATSAQRTAEAESAAMSKTLDKVLSSLETRDQYETLKRKHETEVLPHWMSIQVNNAKHLAGFVFQKTLHNAHTSWLTVTKWISPFTHSITATCSKVWRLRVSPALTSIEGGLESHLGQGWSEFKANVAKAAHSCGMKCQHTYRILLAKAAAVEHELEVGVLNQLRKVDRLQGLAQPTYVHYGLIAIAASIAVPTGLVLLSTIMRALVYRYQSGTANVLPPAIGSELNAIEEKLGYHFAQDSTLKDVFQGASSLTWLGGKILQLLAAEGVLKEGHVGVAPNEGQRVVDGALIQTALSSAAGKAGLAAYVKPGPGLKSQEAASKAAAELYSAVIGAVYLDSGKDIATVRKSVTSTL